MSVRVVRSFPMLLERGEVIKPLKLFKPFKLLNPFDPLFYRSIDGFGSPETKKTCHSFLIV